MSSASLPRDQPHKGYFLPTFISRAHTIFIFRPMSFIGIQFSGNTCIYSSPIVRTIAQIPSTTGNSIAPFSHWKRCGEAWLVPCIDHWQTRKCAANKERCSCCCDYFRCFRTGAGAKPAGSQAAPMLDNSGGLNRTSPPATNQFGRSGQVPNSSITKALPPRPQGAKTKKPMIVPTVPFGMGRRPGVNRAKPQQQALIF